MCGIVGVHGLAARYRGRFGAALDSIAHRGPDGEGRFERSSVLLGHRRLAIIDLTDGGAQPMTDPETGATIVYNGEIYNYIEVRAELVAAGYTFRSESDTEVLLTAFRHWGTAMFGRLNGMFAFAIWEPEQDRLTLARDRFGVKPLYWTIRDGTLLFASEVKALIALDGDLAEPEPRADSYACARDHSYYRHVRSLPPAHFARFTPGESELAPRRYWDFPEAEGAPPGEAESAEEFAALFSDAVRLRLRSDVPVGLTLSGGLDSSAVLAAAQAQSGAPIRCFTAVYGADARGEEAWAQRAAAAWSADLEAVEAQPDAWLPTLERIVWHMDGPGYTPAVFPLWAIMRRAREAGVPVLLEGQGADELLAGYTQYAAVEAAGLLAGAMKGQVAGVAPALRAMSATFGGRQLALWMLRQRGRSLETWLGPRRRRVALFNADMRFADRSWDTRLDGHAPLQAALHRDFSDGVLPALLQYGDAVSMAHGIEVRLPFMDYRLVEWVFRRRPALLAGGRSKAPLRAFLGANRLKEIAQRVDKKGFPTSLPQWLAAPSGRAFLGDMLASRNAPIWSLLDRKAVAAFVERALLGDFVDTFHLYKIVTTHIWLEQLSDRSQGGLLAEPLRKAG